MVLGMKGAVLAGSLSLLLGEDSGIGVVGLGVSLMGVLPHAEPPVPHDASTPVPQAPPDVSPDFSPASP